MLKEQNRRGHSGLAANLQEVNGWLTKLGSAVSLLTVCVAGGAPHQHVLGTKVGGGHLHPEALLWPVSSGTEPHSLSGCCRPPTMAADLRLSVGIFTSASRSGCASV